MKAINITITSISLLLSGLASAQITEITEVTAGGQVSTEVEVSSNQQEVTSDAISEQVMDSPEMAKPAVLVEQPSAVAEDPNDEWTLMNQLIEAKKQNEAKAKAKIENLTEVNTQLNVEVEENNIILAEQEETIGGLEIQLQSLQTSAADIESRLSVMQENTDTVSYEFKKLKFKNTASMLTPFLYAAGAILIADKFDASSDSKLIYGLGAFSAGTLIESTDYGLSFQLTKIVYKQ